MRRAARPGARIAVVTWLPLRRNPLFRALRDAVGTVLGPEPAARFEEPWSLGGDEVADLVRGGGLRQVEVREWTVPVTVPGGPDALCCLFGFSAISPYVSAHRRRSRTPSAPTWPTAPTAGRPLGDLGERGDRPGLTAAAVHGVFAARRAPQPAFATPGPPRAAASR